MNINQVPEHGGRRSYHSPIRPWLRWPAMLAGAFMLVGALFLGVAHGDWRWQPIMMGMAFMLLGRSPTEIRHDGLSSSPIMLLTAAFLAIGLIAVSWMLSR